MSINLGCRVCQAYSVNDVFKTLSLVIGLFPLFFSISVQFKIVHFLDSCFSDFHYCCLFSFKEI